MIEETLQVLVAMKAILTTQIAGNIKFKALVKRRTSHDPNAIQLLGSCEIRRLTQLTDSTDFIWLGLGFLHAWPAVNND